jgi:hypothetical protein
MTAWWCGCTSSNVTPDVSALQVLITLDGKAAMQQYEFTQGVRRSRSQAKEVAVRTGAAHREPVWNECGSVQSVDGEVRSQGKRGEAV